MRACRAAGWWLCVIIVAACGGDGSETDDTGPLAFETGPFWVTTTGIDDRCLDGGLHLLFMPAGPDEPWDWTYPITVFAPDELPQTHEIRLREPFGEMTVDVRANGDRGQQMVAQENQGVLLDEAQFGQCVADMSAEVTLTLVSRDRVHGTARIELTDPRGDPRCPTDLPSHCEVILTFEGRRAATSE